VTVGFLCWFVCGYSFALGVGENPNKFIGTTNFFTAGFWDNKELFRVWFFQGAFCATGGTIVSGAMAERTQLKGFATFTIIMTSFIYPCIVYWGWSGSGLLNFTDDNGESKTIFGTPPLMDFAGSGIVHLTGAVGALCGAVIVGPRKGRFDPALGDEFLAHNVPFVVLGTFFLWFGWYGFNPGSTLSMKTASDGHTAGLVACNTTLAPVVAGLVVFFLRAQVVEPKCLDVGGFCNGILAGLVSITAGCGSVKPFEAMVIGLVGGFVYQGASMLIRKLEIDDVVDAVPVHGACGIWGLLALGIFGEGSIFSGSSQIVTQLLAAVIIFVWVGGLSTAIFLPLKMVGWLRLSDDFQDKGADEMEHSPRKSYNMDDAPAQAGNS